MEEKATSFALEFDFKGSSQICVVDYDTEWIDVFAMVKCSLELEDMQVKYVDDESDEVNLNSEAEYSLARELARKQGNVLKFSVYRTSDQSASFSTVERKMKPVGPPTGSIYDSVTGCAVPGLGECRPVDSGALASISMSEDTMNKMKKPPDQFVNSIVQDILQGLDGSLVLEEDAEEFKVTQRKIRQGIKEKNQSSNIEWSPSCTRIPKGRPVPNEEFVNKVVQGVLSGLNGAELRSAMESENNRRRAAGVTHNGVRCDNCRNGIVGIRYKCVHCPNFDLCSSCEALASSHDENHVFLKLYKPAMKGLGLRFDNQPIPLLDIPIYPTDEGVAVWEQKKLRYAQKIAYKIAKAEMKFKRKEEKRKRKEMGMVQVSPTKRERLEKMVTAIEDGQKEESSLITGSYITKDKLLKDWTKEYNCLLLGDVNIPSGTHLQPGTKFTKTWRVLNGGDIPFDDNTSLKFLWGNIPNLSDKPTVPHLHPGQEGILSVECEAPIYPGTYQSTWRLVNNGCQFGQRFTCNIVVDKAELLEPKEETPVSVEKGMLIVQHHQAECALEASEAVANLQPDQSDSSSPNKVISNNTDLLTAQDILSFEMLKISKKGSEEEEYDDVEIEVQAVPTPNNTPCGMTPCMSPVPQLDAECLSSKISDNGGIKDRVVETRIEEVEEQSAATTDTASSEDPDMVIVDRKSEDTSSVGSADEDLLGDFYVVPLPDCFDLSKPLEECVLSTSTMKAADNYTVPDEMVALEAAPVETVSDIDSMLATSHTLIQTPLVPLVAATPIQPQVEMVPHTIVTSPGTYTAPEIVLDVVNISDNVRCGFVVSPDQDAVPVEAQSESAAISEKVMPLEDEEEAVTHNNIETPVSDENGNSLEVEPPTQEEVMENCHHERDVNAAEFFHDAEESNISPPREEGAEIPREMTSDMDQGADPQKEDEKKEGDEDVVEERTDNLSSYQLQGHDQAREILGMTAARAAQVASSAFKQAFDVANSAVSALLTPQSPQAPLPKKESQPNPMDTLIEMGFANRERNKELLYKFNNDVNQCVQELLSEDVANWHLTRH